MADEPAQDGNSYFIDAESAAEMARLMHQDRLLTQGMGTLIPENVHLAANQRVLDIGCGPGGWVLDVAYKYPKVQVVGGDVSRQMVDYARAQAWSRGLDNATFKVLDALKPLDIPDDSFDFVNTRFVAGFMPAAAWPQLVQECLRITRPGGCMRLTECEVPFTSSEAFTQMLSVFTHAYKNSGRNFSTSSEHVGITPMLRGFLEEAGCINIQEAAHMLNFSSGTEAHLSTFQDFMAIFHLARPFLLKWTDTTPQQYDDIYQRMVIEMQEDSFRAVWLYVSAWGQKAS